MPSGRSEVSFGATEDIKQNQRTEGRPVSNQTRSLTSPQSQELRGQSNHTPTPRSPIMRPRIIQPRARAPTFSDFAAASLQNAINVQSINTEYLDLAAKHRALSRAVADLYPVLVQLTSAISILTIGSASSRSDARSPLSGFANIWVSDQAGAVNFLADTIEAQHDDLRVVIRELRSGPGVVEVSTELEDVDIVSVIYHDSDDDAED